MLLDYITEDCLRYVLLMCDAATIEVLYHVPEIVPTTLLEKYRGKEVNVLSSLLKKVT